MNHDSDGKISYSWFDETDVNRNLIDTFWCQNVYPLSITNNHNYTTSISYTYTNGTCWMNTFNSSHQMHGWICGPSTHIYCWFNIYALPATIFTFIFIYSSCILCSLRYHLYKQDHNWQIPPTVKSKISAILFVSTAVFMGIFGILWPIVEVSGYIKSNIAPPNSWPIDPLYPKQYTVSWILMSIWAIALVFFHVFGYLHILLRVYDFVKNTNSIIRKHYFAIIGVFIITVPVCMVLLVGKNSSKVLPEGFKYSPWPPIIAVILVVSLIVINVGLLSCYTIALHQYAQQFFNIEMARDLLNTNLLHCKEHELMLEATRYVVLFGSVAIADILLILFGVYAVTIHEDEEQCQWDFTVVQVMMGIEGMVFLQSIYLSFVFKHATYLKKYRCGLCHECVKGCCYKLAKRKQRKRLQESDEEIELLYHKSNNWEAEYIDADYGLERQQSRENGCGICHECTGDCLYKMSERRYPKELIKNSKGASSYIQLESNQK